MGHDDQKAVRIARHTFFLQAMGGVQKAKNGRELNGRTYDAMPELSTHEPPQRLFREQLLGKLAQVADCWQNDVLVKITHRASTA
jgi:hypothetical protein